MQHTIMFVLLVATSSVLAVDMRKVQEDFGPGFAARLAVSYSYSCFKTGCGTLGDTCGLVHGDTLVTCQPYDSYCVYTSDDGLMGVCTAQLPNGAYCNKSVYGNTQCTYNWLGNTCQNMITNNTCGNGGKKLKESCVNDWDCISNYAESGYCDNTTKTCVSYPVVPAGGNCSEYLYPFGSVCAPSYTCFQDTCVKEWVNGTACNSSNACYGTCLNNICIDEMVQPVGAPCGTNDDLCADGLICLSSKLCGPPPEADIACSLSVSSSYRCPTYYTCACDPGRQDFRCVPNFDTDRSAYRNMLLCGETNIYDLCETQYIKYMQDSSACEANAASSLVAASIASILAFALALF